MKMTDLNKIFLVCDLCKAKIDRVIIKNLYVLSCGHDICEYCMNGEDENGKPLHTCDVWNIGRDEEEGLKVDIIQHPYAFTDGRGTN